MRKRFQSSAWLALACGLLSSPALAEDAGALPEPLRLEQVIRFAREHRAEIAAARFRVSAAERRPAVVGALDDPTLFPAIDHLPFSLEGADASLTVEQRFPLSGVLGDRRRAAEAEVLRFRAEAARVALDVERDAAAAFLMLRERREMAAVFAEQRSLAQELLRAATARYASGLGTQAEALRAETELARVEGALRASAAEVRGAEAMLNAGLARPIQAVVPALDAAVPSVEPPTAEAALRAALENRPELRAGTAEVSRAEAEVSAMRSMYAPMAMVRTGPAYTMTDGPGWMVMVGVTLPIWRSKLSAGVAEAQAMVQMAHSDLASMRRMVEGDALASREQVMGARDRYLSLRDEVLPRAKQTIEPALASYASGQLPLVSVLEATQALWNAQMELIAAKLELGLAWVRLQRATGHPGGQP